MNWLDYLILLVLVVSALVAVFRGFVREIVSLAVWVAGIFLTIHYMPALKDYFSQWTSSIYLQYIIIIVLALVMIVLVGFILRKIFSLATKATALGAVDKFLGLVFGLVRGCLIIVFLVMLVPLAGFAQSAAVQRSVLLPVFRPMSNWMRGLIPADFQEKIQMIKQADSEDN